VARWYHGVLAAVVATGLLIQLVLLVAGGDDVSTGATETAVPLPTRLIRLFSYFTIQSNILVLAASLTLARNPARDGRLWRVLRLDALLGIVITGIVFATVLAPLVHLQGIGAVANALLHYVSPWACLLGWLLLGPRPRIGWATVGWAFVWPLLWIGYTAAHGVVTGWYPYPFLDAGELGDGVALRNTLFILIFAIVLALLLKLADRLPTVTGHRLSASTEPATAATSSRGAETAALDQVPNRSDRRRGDRGARHSDPPPPADHRP